MGGLSLFLYREGSRNQLNNDRLDGYFSMHYNQLTGKRLLHMDTVNGVLCDLSCEALEQTRMDLMSRLFEQKRKAFIRLAAKLKKQYPRLPVCILADGLYPYKNAFKTCEDNGWKFIFVLQDNSLKTVQEELTLTRRSASAASSCKLQNGW